MILSMYITGSSQCIVHEKLKTQKSLSPPQKQIAKCRPQTFVIVRFCSNSFITFTFGRAAVGSSSRNEAMNRKNLQSRKILKKQIQFRNEISFARCFETNASHNFDRGNFQGTATFNLNRRI